MYGWNGKIAFINLSTQKVTYESPGREIYELWIGGKGLASYYLKESVTLPWDHPEMPLLFFTGPLVDSGTPSSGRFTVMSRSPLTGTVGDTSVGGRWGVELKRCGLDGLVITGQSQHTCGLMIRDGEITFTEAAELKGLPVNEAMEKLALKGSTAMIGPAAENGVLYSSIVIDTHYLAGRNGLGLVMGKKNLKYINVAGTGKTAVYNKEIISQAREQILRLTSASPVLKGELGISHYGTGALYDLIHTRRMMPTDNFRATYFQDAAESNAWQYEKRYTPKKTGCAGCTIACKKIGSGGEVLPEYETMSHFTALIGNRDIDIVVKANALCNNLGMDTISAAATLACYKEISGEKFSGQKILTLLEDIGLDRGLGRELKLGSYRYAEKAGHPEAAITVKKQELPAYDPRGAYGMALAYATSTRGACHLRAYPVSHEILRKPVATNRFTFSGKARIIKIAEDQNAVIDSLAACKFLFFAATLEEYAKAFYGVTGIETTAQDLLKAGERIYYNDRIMNALNGFSAEEDDLPARFFTTPGSSSQELAVPPLNREEFLKTLENYYRIRGLDNQGRPLKEKATELGLTWKE